MSMHSPEPTPSPSNRVAYATSPEMTEIAKALVGVQAEVRTAQKNATNPHFKSRYADLAEISDACRPALVKHGICVVQSSDSDGERAVLVTLLLHTSGQWIRGVYPLKPVKNDPQSMGSAVTYARRYALAAMVGVVADDDDDGQRASTPSRNQQVNQQYYEQPRAGYAPPPQDDFPASYGGPQPEPQTVAPPAQQQGDPRLVRLYGLLADAKSTSLIETVVAQAKSELGDGTPAFLAFREEALKQWAFFDEQEQNAPADNSQNPIAAE